MYQRVRLTGRLGFGLLSAKVTATVLLEPEAVFEQRFHQRSIGKRFANGGRVDEAR